MEIAVFSDGRANVPLGGATELANFLESGGDARHLTESAAEQCRTPGGSSSRTRTPPPSSISIHWKAARSCANWPPWLAGDTSL